MRDFDEWVVSPESIIRRAVAHGMITIDESTDPKFLDSARYEAENLRDTWPEGEGFGSSDFTFTLKSFLEGAGVKTAWVDHRLTRVA